MLHFFQVHAFQLWCTKCRPAGTAAFRNTPNIFASSAGEIQKQPGAPRNRFRPSTGSSRTHRTAFRTTPKLPRPKYWRDSAESLSRKYWQYLNTVITMPTMRFPNYWRESETILSTTESLSPLITQASPEPTALHPEPRRKCSAPSTDGVQNQSTARGNRFPQTTPSINAWPQVLAGFRINQRHGGVAFPQILAVPGQTGCRVAGRCEERNTVFAKRSKLGRSH